MKPYGASRRDTLSCDHGCCGNKLAYCFKGKRFAKIVRRSAKKRARRVDPREAPT